MSTFSDAVAPDVRIRSPLWMRIYAGVFAFVWFGLLAVIGVLTASSQGGVPVSFLLVAAPMMMVAGFVVYQTFRVGVVATGDQVEVRNYFSRRAIFRRHEIEGFRTGAGRMPFARSGFLLTTAGEIVDLHATLQPTVFGRGRYEHQVDALRRWRGTRPAANEPVVVTGAAPGPSQLLIRPPKSMLVFTAGFGVVWVVFLLTAAVREPRPQGLFLVMPLLMMVWGLFIVYQTLRLGVWARGDELTIRNIRSTTSFHRSELRGFRIGVGGGSRRQAVHVLTVDGEVLILQATMQLMPWGEDHYQQQAKQLTGWLNRK